MIDELRAAWGATGRRAVRAAQLVGAPRNLSQREDTPPQALAHEVNVVARAELLAHGAQRVADGRRLAVRGRGDLIDLHAGEELQDYLALVVGDRSRAGLCRSIFLRARHHDRVGIGPRLEWRVSAVDRGARTLAVVWVLGCTMPSCRDETAQSMLKLVTKLARYDIHLVVQ